MSKAYVMLDVRNGKEQVLAVFSSEKKARAAKKWLLEIDTYYSSHADSLRIDTFEINGEKITDGRRAKQ